MFQHWDFALYLFLFLRGFFFLKLFCWFVFILQDLKEVSKSWRDNAVSHASIPSPPWWGRQSLFSLSAEGTRLRKYRDLYVTDFAVKLAFESLAFTVREAILYFILLIPLFFCFFYLYVGNLWDKNNPYISYSFLKKIFPRRDMVFKIRNMKITWDNVRGWGRWSMVLLNLSQLYLLKHFYCKILHICLEICINLFAQFDKCL